MSVRLPEQWRTHLQAEPAPQRILLDDALTKLQARDLRAALRCRVNPFDPDSPIKALPVEKFPSDMFFVLRTVQLLRGVSRGCMFCVCLF